MVLKELRAIEKKIDTCKKVIATNRDKLREILDELETTVNSFDQGIDALDTAKEYLEDGIDSISEVV